MNVESEEELPSTANIGRTGNIRLKSEKSSDTLHRGINLKSAQREEAAALIQADDQTARKSCATKKKGGGGCLGGAGSLSPRLGK